MVPNIETTYRALLLNVMVVMMEEDGVLEHHEVSLIGDVFEDLVGFRLSPKIRSRLIGSVKETRRQVLEQLKARASLLSEAQRESIFDGALQMLRADQIATSREYRFLRDIGLALGMADAEIDRHF
jgi:hypothetical protein